MLIRSTREAIKETTIVYDGDKVVITHASHVDPLINSNRKLRRIYKWNGKTMRLRARIDPLVFLSRPELQTDPKALDRFLKSPEGEPWLVSKDGEGHPENRVYLPSSIKLIKEPQNGKASGEDTKD